MPHASMVLPDRVDPKDLKETKLLEEIRGLLDLKAIRALRDPRAILVNPSQLLLLCHLRVSMEVNETGIASLQ